MSHRLTRRTVFGIGGGVAAGAALGAGAMAYAADGPASARKGPVEDIKDVYTTESTAAGGTWNSYLTVAGTADPVIAANQDTVVEAYSVNKIAVATAVLDKVDRGEATLDQRLDVPADIVIPDGDGILRLDGAYPSSITLGHVLALLLTVSDDTCVRLCGLVTPAAEINETLVAKGFPKTQVVPVDNPNRFFLGQTTPKEMHDLLNGIVAGTVLTPKSSEYLLGILRSPVAFTDGIRRVMSSADRGRVATKAGWLDEGRMEAGVMFGADGTPKLTYSLFAFLDTNQDDYGATHPLVQARSVMGPRFLAAADQLGGSATTSRTLPAPAYRPSNGG
jgi:beta-lactamase class A